MQRILMIEDDMSIVRSLTDFLKGEGFWAESASGQKEALEKIEDDPQEPQIIKTVRGVGYRAGE